MSVDGRRVLRAMITNFLECLDAALHRALDGYINAQRPGWGRAQLAQWHVCNAYTRRAGSQAD